MSLQKSFQTKVKKSTKSFLLIYSLACCGPYNISCAMATIVPNDDVFAQFKDESSKQCRRVWSQFREFISSDFDCKSGPPGEECFTKFFKFQRNEKKYASTTMWTFYSCLNSIMKRRYNVKLQELSRLTSASILIFSGISKIVSPHMLPWGLFDLKIKFSWPPKVWYFWKNPQSLLVIF